jgi:hypothetical protein
MRPRVLIVSYHAANPLTPRGARSQAAAAALSAHADVHVIAGPDPAGRRLWWHPARDRALFEIGSRWLIDPLEPWSWKALASRALDADAAMLIGYPFSPLVAAAGGLRRQGVPYVVDISDPWALTRFDGQAPTLRDRRSATLERRLWSGAAAGIVTTSAQGRDLVNLVPGLDILVRPNGYTDVGPVRAAPRAAKDDVLRIGHFGSLYAPRVDITGFLRRLVESGRWRRVVLQQYGRDHYGELRRFEKLVTVQRRDPVPWPEAVRLAAAEVDIGLVVGNTDPRQLPSKAIEYLTLPVPRLALTGGRAGDALAEYVDGKPGWLTLNVDAPDAASHIWEHLRGRWTAEELAPPADESWERVAEKLASFVLRKCAGRAGAGALG